MNRLGERTVRIRKVEGSIPFGSTKLNDPTQFEEVDETCGLSRGILYLEGLGMTVFLKTLYQSEYETLKFKPFQIEVENEKIRRFEHRCLSCRSC